MVKEDCIHFGWVTKEAPSQMAGFSDPVTIAKMPFCEMSEIGVDGCSSDCNCYECDESD